MKDGSVLESGEPIAVYQDPKNLYTARLLANCNVLDKDKAKLCGINIKGKKKTAAIYPEWLKLNSGANGDGWHLKTILFKGFYEEVLLEKDDVMLRARNYQPGNYHPGDSVYLEANKWLEY
jgi:ABC-type Fe3+/spermidine/putrescine transport system ATPase subunit